MYLVIPLIWKSGLLLCTVGGTDDELMHSESQQRIKCGALGTLTKTLILATILYKPYK